MGESVNRYNLAIDSRGRVVAGRGVELDRLVQHPDREADKATLAKVEAELAAGQKKTSVGFGVSNAVSSPTGSAKRRPNS